MGQHSSRVEAFPLDPYAMEDKMCLHEEAVEYAFTTFNCSLKPENEPYEQGCLLWADKRLIPGPWKISNDSTGIDLFHFDDATGPFLMGSHVDSTHTVRWEGKDYHGDYHIHPYTTIRMQFPSPQDLTLLSAVCDYWIIPEHGPSPVRISPKLQMIQSSLFGDVFVIRRNECISRLGSYAVQASYLDTLTNRYAVWYNNVLDDLCAPDWDGTRTAFAQLVDRAIPDINNLLDHRATCEFRQNHANSSTHYDDGVAMGMLDAVPKQMKEP